MLLVGLFEFYRMQENRRVSVFRKIGLGAGAVLWGAVWLKHFLAVQRIEIEIDPVFALLMVSWIIAGLTALLHHKDDSAVDRFTYTMAGLLYVWLPLVFMFEIRNLFTARDLPGYSDFTGILAVIHLLVTAKIGDVTAFFTGRLLGRRKLAPALSPGKTVEGAVGGLVGSVAVSTLMCLVTELNDIYGILGGVIFGFAVGVLSQAGDLFESLLKRKAGVKNSGELIPEFGGMLDLLDCLLFSGPVAYFILLWYI
jgi:phosphatidate cytidylyltransferase